MIFIDKGKIEISGTEVIIRAEFCTICKELREKIYTQKHSEEESENMINKDFEISKMSTEELEKNVLKLIIEKLAKELNVSEGEEE